KRLILAEQKLRWNSFPAPSRRHAGLFPSHKRAQAAPYFFDTMAIRGLTQLLIPLLPCLHFADEFARKLSRMDITQNRSHLLLNPRVDDLGTHRQFAPSGRVRNQCPHSAHSGLVN